MTLDRRRFLTASARIAVGAAACGALAGCGFHDPRVHGGPTAPPPVPPVTPLPPFAGAETGLRHEVDLAALGTALAAQAAPNVSAQAKAAAQGFRAHAVALAGPKPVERPTTEVTPSKSWSPKPLPSPSVQPAADAKAATAALQARAGQAASAYRDLALAAQGTGALFWASLMVFAQGTAQTVGVDAARPAVPVQQIRPLEVWSDSEAPQQVVRQLHALIYGYQAAIAPLKGADSKAAMEQLIRYRELRDDLSITLRDRGFAVPAAEAAYVLPQQPNSKETAFALIAQMELAFEPFAGGWVAAATDADTRKRAVGLLEQTVRNCVQAGGPLPVWPGWPA